VIAELLKVPRPPHDPRSVLLNGRLGFRAIAPAVGEKSVVEDATRCALTLPFLLSATRDVAEASGSLGGVRPPSNVALGLDGSIYLLDRKDFQIKRFDGCECRFVAVPGVGGEGDGPRQFRSPGAIAIACGSLYVTQQLHVSVFALKGFALRGHLLPPPAQRPWQPNSVAVDSLGRVWAGDATGRLHRFTPHGRWERSWPMVPGPSHLAIDLHDRVYVVSVGGTPSLRVFDRDGQLIASARSRPTELRGEFPRVPFRVDADGDLWLERYCPPSAVAKKDPSADLVFDVYGDMVERAAGPQERYEKSATYRSEPIDSGIAQCVWHRVELSGDLPAGTCLIVRAFCTDEPTSAAEFDVLAAWVECARADAFDNCGVWDCLIRGDVGRYLSLEIRFEGNGLVTPALGAIVVEFPRISLRRFLPAVFGAEPNSADFTDRFLSLYDTTLRSIERRVDDMAQLFDPASAPACAKDPRQIDFLSWLGSWIGIAVDRNWDIATRRRLLLRLGSLFDRRGTLRGLREQLLIVLGLDSLAPCAAEERACGRCIPPAPNCRPPAKPARYRVPPLILEHFRLRRWLRVGAGRLGDEAVFWGESIVDRTRLGGNGQVGVTRLDTSPDPQRDPFLFYANRFTVFVPACWQARDRSRKGLETLIKSESPAGTSGALRFVEPRFRIGVQSMLGFDAVVASLPRDITLGVTPLGLASILTEPPHLEGGPAIALDREGRIGTTTLLA
jgi:phage tail-like protein